MTVEIYENQWPQVKALAEKGQIDEIEKLALGESNKKSSVSFLQFATRALMFRDWQSKSLEPILELGARSLEIAEKIDDIEEANRILFNMSSNLADCWDDGIPRTQRHFKIGLQLADRALKLRRQLNQGSLSFSQAYWAQGIHHFLSNDFYAAEISFSRSLEFAKKAAVEFEKPTTITKDTTFFVLISQGYLSLTQSVLKKSKVQDPFVKVLQAFEEMQLGSEEERENAEIGLKQLRYLSSKQRSVDRHS